VVFGSASRPERLSAVKKPLGHDGASRLDALLALTGRELPSVRSARDERIEPRPNQLLGITASLGKRRWLARASALSETRKCSQACCAPVAPAALPNR
jgi:hypothetical protein